jgi:3-phosphoshikimate 1-carboxyvinyltransferase
MIVEPLERPPDAVVAVPGSKSLTNRALVCAALSSRPSTITNVLIADDTAAMLGGLRGLGYALSLDETARVVTATPRRSEPAGEPTVDARLSGTTARFLLPVLALDSAARRLDGAAPLRARPMGPLFDALRALGATVVEDGADGRLPVTVRGPIAGGTVSVPGDVTSQFLSALLLVGPCLAGGIEIQPTTEVVSRPYLDLTADVMRAFGAEVDRLRAAPVPYTGSTAFAIEPDASAASYFFAAAAITGGRVTVGGLHRASRQGDLRFVEILGEMGAEVRDAIAGLTVRGTGTLRGGEFDLRDLPDMAQTLAAVAVFADSPTGVHGVGFIRGHETDRIAAVVRELRRCGIDAEERADGFVVYPGTPRPATIETYADHRMAMSFALLGLRVPGIEITDPECVAKTFPTYFEVLDSLR